MNMNMNINLNMSMYFNSRNISLKNRIKELNVLKNLELNKMYYYRCSIYHLHKYIELEFRLNS